MQGEKYKLLSAWGQKLQAEILKGKFGKVRQQIAVGPVVGPRVGGLDIYAQEDPVGLKKSLNDGDGLGTALTVPWHYSEGQPTIYSHGKLIRVEVPWPDNLAQTNIPLRTIESAVKGKYYDGWMAGQDENGHLVVPNFHLEPHWLISGGTGSGKSVSMASALGQLMKVADTQTLFVLIDGKHGESFSVFAKTSRLVGPPTYNLKDAHQALTWVVAEMGQRYQALRDSTQKVWDRNTPRLVVAIDEIQTINQLPENAKMISLLLQQGRAAKINLLISTQYPLNAQLGDPTMKQNLGGRVVLKLNSLEASRVAIGQAEPQATKLLGKGDAYIVGGGSFVRVQIAFLSKQELGALPQGPSQLGDWPETEATVEESATALTRGFSPTAIALSILAAQNGIGRPKFKNILNNAGEGKIGMTKLVTLLNFGRDVWETMQLHCTEVESAKSSKNEDI